MEPLFSASSPSTEGSSSLVEIQLLADHELMSLWEQTQIAVAAIESRGGSASTARRYERAVLMEMQKRLAGRPSGELFGLSSDQNAPLPTEDALPHIMMVRA